jgi:NAD(P)-dependent dehydrogenase (short-subunit alcohol dehydrogenase family)
VTRVSTRTAIVTGAGSGIGRAIARRLGSDGFQVALLGRREPRLADVADEIAGDGGESIVVPCDVGDAEAVTEAVAGIVSTTGRIDALVNNAGVGGGAAPAGDLGIAEWEATFRVNVTGAFLMTRAVLPELVRTAGAIVNIGSVNGVVGGPGWSAYCSAKAALLMFTRCVAIDYGARGVRANCVLPGWVSTEMADDAMRALADARQVSIADAYELANAGVPMRRPGTPEEIASVVSFLVGPDSAYVNGAGVPVDGGSLSAWVGGLEFDDAEEWSRSRREPFGMEGLSPARGP